MPRHVFLSLIITKDISGMSYFYSIFNIGLTGECYINWRW